MVAWEREVDDGCVPKARDEKYCEQQTDPFSTSLFRAIWQEFYCYMYSYDYRKKI